MAAAIETVGLTKRYGNAVVLDHLDLTVEQGEVFGYLGPNGAGKSTTISLLLGLIRATSGSARIFGLDVDKDATAVHRRLAYVPSVANLWPSLTGGETIELLANLHGSADEAYRDELIDRFELTPDKKNRAYSHGNRQKVVLVAAFASRAEVLLLDEPTTGLDPLMEQVFRDCVEQARDRGQTVFLSSHILSEVDAVCDRVAMLRSGVIIETGRLEELRGLAALKVRARFTGAVPATSELAGIAGVSHVHLDGVTLDCDVEGSIDPLLKVLASVGVDHLTTREPSLEELFMHRYGGDPASSAPASEVEVGA